MLATPAKGSGMGALTAERPGRRAGAPQVGREGLALHLVGRIRREVPIEARPVVVLVRLLEIRRVGAEAFEVRHGFALLIPALARRGHPMEPRRGAQRGGRGVRPGRSSMLVAFRSSWYAAMPSGPLRSAQSRSCERSPS